MAKFTLAAAPVFNHTVIIPVAGSAEGLELGMTFKHHPISELEQQEEESRQKQLSFRESGNKDGEYVAMAEFIQFIAKGWDLEQEFTSENIIVACSRFPRFFEAVVNGYVRELYCVREKR